MRRMDLDGTQPVQRLPIEGPAELAELAGGFNEMLGHIEARDAMLLQHRASLETEVAQRTQELHDTNLQLQQELAKHRVAEQVIQASRIRMRALIDATHESVLLLDPQGLILAINAFGASRFGRLPEEIHGQNFFDLMPQDLAQTRRALVQQVIATGQPMHSQDHRGAVFFHNSLYPVKNAQGAVESVAVFAKDVTEQHRATEMDSIFSDLDAALLTERSNLESVAQMFCDEVLPVFDLVAAWIARAEKDGQLTLVAGAEVPDAGLLARLDARVLRWDGDGRCPVVLALHSGHWEPISPQSGVCQCCGVHSALGQAQAGIALPLTLRGANWGVLVLYGRDPQQFGAELLTKRLESIAARAGQVFESALQQEWLTLLDTALAGVDNSVFITDAKAKILWVNRAFLQLSGFSSEEVLGHTPHIFSAGVPDSHFNQQFWQTITTGTTWRGDIVNARRDGSHYTVSQTVTPLLNAEGHVSHYISVLEDITQRRSEEERIKHSAQFDLLTDLPNRSLFFDRLGQALALGRRDASSGVLMFLDLDHFKEVNDQFGHAGGDSLLIAVAGRLREQVRESDTVARLGGDEFTVILPKLRDSEDAARLASNIIASLSRPFEIAGKQATIGVSIGIARFPLHGDTVERIVNAADHAMYLSKNAGRNCYTFASVAPEQGATPAPGSAR